MPQVTILQSAIRTRQQMAAAERANFLLAVQYEFQESLGKRDPSIVKIGQTLGVDRHTVRRQLKKYDLTLDCAEVTGGPNGRADATKAL